MYMHACLQGKKEGGAAAADRDCSRNRRSSRELSPQKWALKQERLKRKSFRLSADEVLVGTPWQLATIEYESQVRARNRG